MTEDSFSIISLGKLSKPAEKLIDAIQSGIGVLYEPRKIRQNAQAAADAMIIHAKAQNEVDRIRLSRASARLTHQEMRRQNNIDSVVTKAIGYLPESTKDEELSSDWLTHFFNICQDISEEEMQNLWAKILAGESAKPSSFSLRTLETIKVIDKKVAKLFNTAANYVIDFDGFKVIPMNDNLNQYYDANLLHQYNLQQLEILGLIKAGSGFSIKKLKEKQFTYGVRRFNLKFDKSITSESWDFMFRFSYLTDIGEEIYSLCDVQEPKDYMDTLKQKYKENSFIIDDVI